jgi:DnaJ-class molecular chaperone
MNYYEILGVSPEASPQDIKKAFRQIARECHPDVTGNDEAAAERFKTARKAYETLIDPVTRSRYDKRGQRRGFTSGSFFDAFYRATGQAAGGARGDESRQRRPSSTPGNHDAGGGPGAGRRSARDAGNDLNLDDLFNGFGDFGFGNKRSDTRSSGPARETGPRDHASGARGTPREAEVATPEAGADVHIEVEVPENVARDGGTVSTVYHRMQRVDSWRSESAVGGVARIQDIADIRILPGTGDGEVLRERGLGDAGVHGGTYGDLVVRVRVVRGAARPETPTEGRDASSLPPEERTLAISVVDALLGGRVEIETAAGRVKLGIPPGTSSGRRFRLKGRGEGGGDLYLEARVMVPATIDDESRRLIEEFARLNPGAPRD